MSITESRIRFCNPLLHADIPNLIRKVLMRASRINDGSMQGFTSRHPILNSAWNLSHLFPELGGYLSLRPSRLHNLLLTGEEEDFGWRTRSLNQNFDLSPRSSSRGRECIKSKSLCHWGSCNLVTLRCFSGFFRKFSQHPFATESSYEEECYISGAR